MEYLSLIAEIESLKEQLKALQPPKKPERTLCPRLTSKGIPCKKYCVPGEQTCPMCFRGMRDLKERWDVERREGVLEEFVDELMGLECEYPQRFDEIWGVWIVRRWSPIYQYEHEG